jgi:hypothetical protein
MNEGIVLVILVLAMSVCFGWMAYLVTNKK